MPVFLLYVDIGSTEIYGVVDVFICNQSNEGRWHELRVYRVCQEHEVMREEDAIKTSGELGSAFEGALVGCPS